MGSDARIGCLWVWEEERGAVGATGEERVQVSCVQVCAGCGCVQVSVGTGVYVSTGCRSIQVCVYIQVCACAQVVGACRCL